MHIVHAEHQSEYILSFMSKLCKKTKNKKKALKGKSASITDNEAS